jgi:hypothetical protein
MPELFEIEFVNRDTELQRLRDICTGKRETRILLIKGQEGIGKSWILRCAFHEHRNLPVALMDLALQYGQDPIELVRGLKNQIIGVDWTMVDKILAQSDATSYPADFASYNQEKLLKLITGHFSLDELRTVGFNLGIELDDLRGEGRTAKARELILYMSRRPNGLAMLVNEIRAERPNSPWDDVSMLNSEGTIFLPGSDDRRGKELQLQGLAEAVVNALHTFTSENPVLILLDTYEKGTKSVGEWLGQYFLPLIRKGDLAGLRVVIAGREVPNFDREWRIVVDTTEVVGLAEPAIREYWVLRRRQPETDLRFVQRYSGGIPLMLAQMADIADQFSKDRIDNEQR